MQKELSLTINLKTTLEAYSHIELTEDEMMQAIITAKIKKEEQLRLDRIKKMEEQNRKRKSELFDFLTAQTFFGARSVKLFDGKFVLDKWNSTIFDMMCLYFNNDPMFVPMAEKYGVKNPSLEKGILFAGNFGLGKSWMFKLFMQNKRQSYFIREAKKIADAFVSSKEKQIPTEYLLPFENGFEDSTVFYQKYSGLCIDDIGAERVKNNFGNVSNVIGDLIEQRYSYQPPHEKEPKLVGPMLHGATNLSADELKEYYGERVTSRMREIFNWIVWKGGREEDRRK